MECLKSRLKYCGDHRRMGSPSCGVPGRSYVSCDGRHYPSKSVKFYRFPSISCSSKAEKPSNCSRTSAVVTVENPPRGYRINVGICLVSPSKMVLMASRKHIIGPWQMPQGGVDEGENLRNAARRELREETGVTSAEFLAEAPYWQIYDFPKYERKRLSLRWGTNYRGQAQKWFLFRFTGNEEEIDLLSHGSEKPEFKHWAWILPEYVVEVAVDYKKADYEDAMQLFWPYIQGNGVKADHEDMLQLIRQYLQGYSRRVGRGRCNVNL